MTDADSLNGFPSPDEVYEVDFGGEFVFRLQQHSPESLTYRGRRGRFEGVTETVETRVTRVAEGVFMVSWREGDGSTVVHVRDYPRGIAHTNITMPDGSFHRLSGTLTKIASGSSADAD